MGVIDQDDYTNIIPNFYTRTLAKELVKQFDSQLKNDEFDDNDEAELTIRAPLDELVDYLKSDLAELAEKQKKFVRSESDDEGVITDTTDDSNIDKNDDDDDELEYYAAISTHRAAVV